MPDSFELPFLIDDSTPREWRVPQDPAAVQHANGATGVGEVTLQVHAIAAARDRWRAWLGESFSASATGSEFRLVADGLRVRLLEGDPAGAVSATLLGIRAKSALDPIAHWRLSAG